MPPQPHWQSLQAPWVELLILPKGRSIDDLVQVPAGFQRRTVQGRRCKTKNALLGEFSHALDCPSYFGRNWDALEECLSDLEWLPADGYLVVVTDADLVLTDEPEEYPTLLKILQSIGKSWAGDQASRPHTPFHTLFAVQEDRKEARTTWDIPAASTARGSPRDRPTTSRSKSSRKTRG